MSKSKAAKKRKCCELRKPYQAFGTNPSEVKVGFGRNGCVILSIRSDDRGRKDGMLLCNACRKDLLNEATDAVRL